MYNWSCTVLLTSFVSVQHRGVIPWKFVFYLLIQKKQTNEQVAKMYVISINVCILVHCFYGDKGIEI